MITQTVNSSEIKYYTAKEAAKIIGVDSRTIYRWIYAGKIESTKFDPNNPTAANYIPEYEIPKFKRTGVNS